MFFRERNRNKNIVKGIKTFSGVFFLFLYLAGNVQLESFHQLFHAKVELHTAEHELDPCHRAIYHDAEQGGCDHQTHLTEIKKCPLCHVVPYKEQHLASSHSFESLSFHTSFDNAFSYVTVGEILTSHSVRGPPQS